jgi:vacuolar-type H+-ATPase subunit H
MLTKEDLQAIVETMSPLIDARAKTTETFLKGAINDAKEELRTEVLAARAEAKTNILDLEAKVNKNYLATKARLENLEERAGTHDPTKN